MRRPDVYYTYSDDDGGTGRPTCASPTSRSTAASGPGAAGGIVIQPPGPASAEAYTLVGWDDTRHGGRAGEARDLYAAAAQFRPVSGGSHQLIQHVLSVVGGLVAAGAIVFAVGAIPGQLRLTKAARAVR